MSQLYAAYGTAGGNESQTPLVIGGLDGVKEYANTIMSKAKQKLIRDIARDMKAKFRIEGKGASKVDINPEADLDTLIEQLKKAIPNPSKNGRVFSSKLGTQTKACKTLAQIVNSNFGFAKGSGIIDENADPDEICEKVSEVMYTLFTGMHGEFLGVRADAERLLKNLHHLHEILQRNYNQLMSKMSTADPENVMAETKLARDGHQAILKEMNRQQTMLENMMNVVVSPADRKLAELLKETQDYKRLVKDIKKLPGTGKFGEKLSYVLSGIGTTAQMAQSVDSALKTIQMSAAEYGRQKDLKDLEESVFDKLQAKLKDSSAEELREYIKAARTLFRYDYKRPEIVKELSRTGSAEDQDVDGGATRIQGGLKLDKRVKRRQELKKQLVKAFNARLGIHLENILKSTTLLAKGTGTTVPISDDLRQFTKRLEIMPDLQKRHIYYSLTGYFRDPASREERERFLSSVKSLIQSLEKLKNIDHARDLLKEWQGVVSLVEEFSAKFEKGFGPVQASVSRSDWEGADEKVEGSEETAGGDDPDETPEIEIASGPSISQIGYSLEKAKDIMIYSFRVASIRQNLKQIAPELKHYGEDYEKVLGDAVAESRDRISDQAKEDIKNLEKGTGIYAGVLPVGATLSQKGLEEKLRKVAAFKKQLWDAKIDMLKCAEAVDLYMKHFTDGIVNHVDEIQKVETMLQGTEIISKWFSQASGNLVCSVFDTFPGTYIGDSAKYSNIPSSFGPNEKFPVNGLHYYWRVQSICRLVSTTNAKQNFDNELGKSAMTGTKNPYDNNPRDWNAWAGDNRNAQADSLGDNQASANNIGVPGVPYLGIPPVKEFGLGSDQEKKDHSGDKVLEYMQKAFQNVSVLKNIISTFVTIGDRFGGEELRKKTHMSPIQIYDCLTKYMCVGSLSMGGAGIKVVDSGDLNANNPMLTGGNNTFKQDAAGQNTQFGPTGSAAVGPPAIPTPAQTRAFLMPEDRARIATMIMQGNDPANALLGARANTAAGALAAIRAEFAAVGHDAANNRWDRAGVGPWPFADTVADAAAAAGGPRPIPTDRQAINAQRILDVDAAAVAAAAVAGATPASVTNAALDALPQGPGQYGALAQRGSFPTAPDGEARANIYVSMRHASDTYTGFEDLMRTGPGPNTDQLFTLTIKSIVAKILTVIGVYNMLHRPINRHGLGYFSGTRWTIGGSTGLSIPRIVPEALELYVRLPLLAEFYREVFDFDSNKNPPVPILSMVPDMDGTFQGLVELIFDRAKHVQHGTYSEADIKTIIEEVNKIYMTSKGKNVVSTVINDFIAEINRRYGILVRQERERYQRALSGRYTERYQSLRDEERTDFEILPNEEDNYPRPGPSDSYVTSSGNWSNKNHKWEIDITNHQGYINELRNNIEQKFRNVWDAGDMMNNPDPASSQDQLKSISFENMIKARSEELRHAKGEKEQFRIVQQAINGLGEFSMNAQERNLILFHETVVVGLQTMYALHRMVSEFRARIFKMKNTIDICKEWAYQDTAANRRTPIAVIGGAAAAANTSLEARLAAAGVTSTSDGAEPRYRNTADIYEHTQGAAGGAINEVGYNGRMHGGNADPNKEYAYRFGLNQARMMSEFVELLYGHAVSLDKLVELQVEAIDHPDMNNNALTWLKKAKDNFKPGETPKSLAISIDHSKLMELVEREFHFLKSAMDKFRGLVPKKIIDRYELYKDSRGATQEGSLYWLEKHFIHQQLTGKYEGWEPRHLARTNDACRDIVNYLNKPWRFNAMMTAAGGGYTPDTGVGTIAHDNAAAGTQQAYDQEGFQTSLGVLVSYNRYAHLGAAAARTNGARNANVHMARLLENPSRSHFVSDYTPAGGVAGAALGTAGVYDIYDVQQAYLNFGGGITDFRRSMFYMFNKVLASYVHQFYDPQSEKIYVNVLNSFANGAFSDFVMGDLVPGKQYNDIAPGNGDTNIPSVLARSLALIIRNLMTGRIDNKTYKHFLETDLAEIPLYMKENFKANMPVFIKIFTFMQAKCKLLKSFVDGCRVREDQQVDNEADSKKRMHVVLDQVALGCSALIGCMHEVLEELADDPKFLETHKDSIKEYEAANGIKPLMPLSSAMYHLRNSTNGLHTADAHDSWLPKFKMGTNEFKLAYGVRGVLAVEGDLTLARLPGMKEILQKHNETSENEFHMDEKDLSRHVEDTLLSLRYLIDGKCYKAMLTTMEDPAQPLWVGGNGPGVGAPAANHRLLNHLRVSLTHDTNNRLLATVPFSLNSGVGINAVIQLTENADQRSSRMKLVERVQETDDTIVRGTREAIRVMNIIDLNVVPINIHALMREIPLVNLYNYAYTFDSMMLELFDVDRDISEAKYMSRDVIGPPRNLSAIDLSRYPAPERARKALGWMLVNPYGEITWDEYQVYFSRIVRGALGIDGLGRPRFLGDELYNKSLFGEVYADEQVYDEAGPNVGHGRQSGRANPGLNSVRKLVERLIAMIIYKVCTRRSAADVQAAAGAGAAVTAAQSGFVDNALTTKVETVGGVHTAVSRNDGMRIAEQAAKYVATQFFDNAGAALPLDAAGRAGPPALTTYAQMEAELIAMAAANVGTNTGAGNPGLGITLDAPGSTSLMRRGFAWIAIMAGVGVSAIRTARNMQAFDQFSTNATINNVITDVNGYLDNVANNQAGALGMNRGGAGLAAAPIAGNPFYDMINAAAANHVANNSPHLQAGNLTAVRLRVDEVRNAIMYARNMTARDANNDAPNLDNVHEQGRYLHYLHGTPQGKSDIVAVDVGNYKVLLQKIGKMRFDTFYARSLIWLTNIQRALRLKLRRELYWYNEKIVKENSVMAPSITELYGNDSAFFRADGYRADRYRY